MLCYLYYIGLYYIIVYYIISSSSSSSSSIDIYIYIYRERERTSTSRSYSEFAGCPHLSKSYIVLFRYGKKAPPDRVLFLINFQLQTLQHLSLVDDTAKTRSSIRSKSVWCTYIHIYIYIYIYMYTCICVSVCMCVCVYVCVCVYIYIYIQIKRQLWHAEELRSRASRKPLH